MTQLSNPLAGGREVAGQATPNHCACGCGIEIPVLKTSGRPRRFADGHSARKGITPAQAAARHFWPQVNKNGLGGCWLWTGALQTQGYGQVSIPSLTGSRNARAHRVAYELLVGPIPAGLILDHQCHNRDVSCRDGDSCVHRRCVNPDHLEPTTQRVNTLRGRTLPAALAERTHCRNGHPFNGRNTHIRRDGGRRCRPCHAEYMQARNARRGTRNA